jgi:hypothetical protein
VAASVMAAMLLMLSVGCRQETKSGLLKPVPAPAIMPVYHEVAFRSNQHVAMLDRLWSHASVEVRFLDEKKKKRRERGDDSTLMIEVPSRLALSIGKMGNTIIWAGCDSQRYWLFDLFGDKGVIHGRHELLYRYEMPGLPLKIRPSDLPLLLGLLPIDPGSGAAQDPPVGWAGTLGAFVVQPPGAPIRLFVDHKTWLPVRVELMDPHGGVAVISELSDHQPVEMVGVGLSAAPRIATRISMSLKDEYFAMDMQLSRMTDARGAGDEKKGRAFGRAFDFDYLADHAFEIRPQDRVDLDEVAARERPQARR